ncbi:MAG: PEP-CTERM sorting domain-containing protein [Myxococcota bacterium]
MSHVARPIAAVLTSTLALFCIALAPASARSITLTPFGAGGLGGTLNGQSLQFGADGSVFELDAFLHAGAGPALSLGSLPPGGPLDIAFGASLSADGSDLLLTYELTNNDVAPIAGLSFLSFVDAEIAEPTTSFFNEVATVVGAQAAGQGFEIDEPGYVFGDIVTNIGAGALDGTNAVGPGAPDDVSMALSFSIGSLDPGDLARIQIQLSEDGDGLGPLLLVQSDPLAPGTTLTYSGQSRIVRASAPIPEPGSAVLFVTGAALLLRRRGGRR